MNLKGRKFENTRLGMEIYVYDIDGKEWFIGKDMIKLLGYSENSKPLRKGERMVLLFGRETRRRYMLKLLKLLGILKILRMKQ